MGVKRSAKRAPRETSHILRDRIIALLAFSLAAALFYYLTHLPVAIDLQKLATIEVRLAEELVVADPQPPQLVLAYAGGLGETVDVRLERAQLNADTVAALTALGFTPPTAAGEIAWITREGKGSQSFIHVGLAPSSGAHPQLHIAPAGTSGHPALKLRAQGAGITIEMGVPLGDTGVDTGSKKQLNLPGLSIASLPGAFPIQALAVDQTSVGLQFGASHSASSLLVGNQELATATAPGLAATAVGIKELQTDAPYELWMCAATRGAVAWWPPAVSEGNCAAPEAVIRLVKFELAADVLKVEFAGSAFVVKDGAPITDDWYDKLENNKLISVLLGLFYAALAGWVWKVFLGSKK